MSYRVIGSCKELVKQEVLKRPVTFMKLVSETQCATETVEKYLSEFLKETLVNEKKENSELFILQMQLMNKLNFMNYY